MCPHDFAAALKWSDSDSRKRTFDETNLRAIKPKNSRRNRISTNFKYHTKSIWHYCGGFINCKPLTPNKNDQTTNVAKRLLRSRVLAKPSLPTSLKDRLDNDRNDPQQVFGSKTQIIRENWSFLLQPVEEKLRKSTDFYTDTCNDWTLQTG